MFVGIDLSGRSRRLPHTAVVRVDDDGALIDYAPNDQGSRDLWGSEGDRKLVEFCSNAAVVALDAPLTLPPALRPHAELPLEEMRLPCYTRRKVDQLMGGMPFAPLAGIAARGIALARRLSDDRDIRTIETYPALTARALSGDSTPSEAVNHRGPAVPVHEKERLLEKIPCFVEALPMFADSPAHSDILDACLAALVAHAHGHPLAHTPNLRTVAGQPIRATTVGRAVDDPSDDIDDVWFAHLGSPSAID